MKKAIGQTVRELKREVNKKVLKVPGIEQKVLDATSNEPWGPHGSLLADIAMATRNYHEYQMIMAVVWKRISDTGKNWRHVYKGLIVLEYLVANGSERVIDDIREHAYQISTLSEFQYIDSSGRDQGNNVRRKSQSLVSLVNDKERIAEVRQKAATNRDKFRNTSGGGMYRPGGYGDKYDYDRYEGQSGSRDGDQDGYGREREYDYKDDERYKNGDSYNRNGDRYGRDYEDRYGKDSYRDDDYRGRNTDEHQENGSARGSGARTEDYSQDGRRFEKSPEQNGGPPSYEEASSENRSPGQIERNGETSAETAPTTSSPPASYSQSPQTTPFGDLSASVSQGTKAFDEFDPRSSASAAQEPAASRQTAASIAPAVPTTSAVSEVDLLGSLSDSFSSALAIVPAASAEPTVDASAASQATFTASNQAFDDPFGDGPFKAAHAAPSSHVGVDGGFAQAAAVQSESVSNFGFGDSFSAVSHSSNNVPNGQPPSSSSQPFPQELSAPHQEPDILADILPLSGSFDAAASQAPLPGQNAHLANPYSQPASSANGYSQPTQPGTNMFSDPALPTASPYGQPPQPTANPYGQPPQLTANPYQPPQPSAHPYGQPPQPTANPYGQPAHVSPYAQQTQPPFNPYSQQPQPQPSVNPYGQPAQGTVNPYGQPAQGTVNPYGQPAQGTINPYTQQPQPSANRQTESMNLLALPAPTVVSQPSQGGASVGTANITHPQPSTGPGAASFLPQQASPSLAFSHSSQQVTNASAGQQRNDLLLANNSGTPQPPSQPSKDKFELKSAVWADTLSRGLVNLNISGPKTNPLADIGVDFDAINRKEKRLEKPSATPVTSTVTMGKAMGSGSGMGRAGAIRAPPNPMMGSGMGMGMGMGAGPSAGMGMGMGGYMGMNQQPMGMGMGMARGVNMQQPMGMPHGSSMPSGYSPMMGSGAYAPQQPYGGGYR